MVEGRTVDLDCGDAVVPGTYRRAYRCTEKMRLRASRCQDAGAGRFLARNPEYRPLLKADQRRSVWRCCDIAERLAVNHDAARVVVLIRNQ